MEPRAEPVARPDHLGPECAVEVELGCADAKFSFELASRHPDRFVVGLDIRQKVIDANEAQVVQMGLSNLRFGYVNMGVDLDRVFARKSVQRFHLLFPDPWFKSRHRKRRVIEPQLLETLADQLLDGGELHFASDVYEVALEALDELESSHAEGLGFSNMAGSWSFWRGNPFGASSRREDTTVRRGQRVWRMRFRYGSPDSSSSETAGSGAASSSASQPS
jgi:tRNA (guanine-N7-)-methyltransferase